MPKLCASMGIAAVNGGVESEAELRTRVGLGADLWQGYPCGRMGVGSRPERLRKSLVRVKLFAGRSAPAAAFV